MSTAENQVSDGELKKVISDFLDQGLIENIVAMFRREPMYYLWTGELLTDERFSVRLGISVLFEELRELQPDRLSLAVPSLAAVLNSSEPLYRGEAISILGIIGSEEALNHVRTLSDDPSPQVREMVQMVLDD
jgi:hypothetical protein